VGLVIDSKLSSDSQSGVQSVFGRLKEPQNVFEFGGIAGFHDRLYKGETFEFELKTGLSTEFLFNLVEFKLVHKNGFWVFVSSLDEFIKSLKLFLGELWVVATDELEKLWWEELAMGVIDHDVIEHSTVYASLVNLENLFSVSVNIGCIAQLLELNTLELVRSL